MVRIVEVAASAFAKDIRIIRWRHDRDGSSCAAEKVTEVVCLLFCSVHPPDHGSQKKLGKEMWQRNKNIPRPEADLHRAGCRRG